MYTLQLLVLAVAMLQVMRSAWLVAAVAVVSDTGSSGSSPNIISHDI
jgi:hypothetical protein